MDQAAPFDFSRLAPQGGAAKLSYEQATNENRSAPRVRIAIPAMLRPSGSVAFKVRVRDLSPSGFSCEAVTGMPVGARCWLALPGIVPQQSQIIWNDGSAVGGAFDMLLNASVLEAMVGRFSALSVVD